MPLGDYGLAMRRKLAIAEFHFDEMQCAPAEPDDQGLPPIALQAHFEAAGHAVFSIPDQLATGIAEALRHVEPDLPALTASNPHTVADRLSPGAIRSRLEQIAEDERYVDLKAWRNRTIHRFDRKSYVNGRWHVAPTAEGAVGITPRDTTSYIGAVLDCVREIVYDIPDFEALIRRLTNGSDRV